MDKNYEKKKKRGVINTDWRLIDFKAINLHYFNFINSLSRMFLQLKFPFNCYNYNKLKQ